MKKILLKSAFVIFLLAIILILLTGCEFKLFKNSVDEIKNTAENTVNEVTQSYLGNEVTKIEYERKTEDDTSNYLIVTGIDKDGHTVWTYESAKDYAAQNETIELLGNKNNLVYLNEKGTIVALDKQTGTKLWSNNEYKGSGSIHTFDSEGYLYVAGSISPYLFVVDAKGNTIAKIENIEDNDLFWPISIRIIDDYMLKIIYPSSVVDDAERDNEVVIDIRDLKNTDNKILAREAVAQFDHKEITGFEDVKTFKLSENGDLSIVFEPYSKIAEKYTNGTIKIASNVKSITPLFTGSSSYGTLIIIKTDGTVEFLDSMNVQMSKITTSSSVYPNISYVISINTLDGFGFGLVDTSGNVTVIRV